LTQAAASPDLLELFDLQGAVVSLDAMFGQSSPATTAGCGSAGRVSKQTSSGIFLSRLEWGRPEQSRYVALAVNPLNL